MAEEYNNYILLQLYWELNIFWRFKLFGFFFYNLSYKIVMLNFSNIIKTHSIPFWIPTYSKSGKALKLCRY